MGILKSLGIESAYQTFNNYLSNIIRKRNASVVGPSKQITGEFPEVTFPRLYEYYHGWDQIKRAVDTMHQKFMGAGIQIRSDSDEFDYFIESWMEITNFQKKISEFFLTVFITGNGFLELQWTDDQRIGNVEQIPMQTIYRIFRDEFGQELKLVQLIDGIFKELDPQFYVHWMINNPDRSAFGKSEFHSLAAPRKVSGKIDPNTGEAINPERTMVSLLDAQAELQNAEIEIKKIMAKPRVFASFPGMPQHQLDKLQKELQDSGSSQTIWAFDKKADMSEAQFSPQARYESYGEHVDEHIDVGTGFASNVVKHPGGFSYSSSQTPFDVMDQRMVDLQSEAKEMIRDHLLRPLAESWGIQDFDDLNVEVHFQPSVRRLTMEDIQKLPTDAVSPIEKREILKTLHIPLDDSEFQKYKESGEQAEILSGASKAPTESPMGKPSQGQGKSAVGDQGNQQAPAPKPAPQGKPKPTKENIKINEAMRDPNILEAYINQQVGKSLERITMSPRVNNSDIYVPGGLNDDSGNPEITDDAIMDRILDIYDPDSQQQPIQQDNQQPAVPMQVSPIPAEGYPFEEGDDFDDKNPPLTGKFDTTSGLGNKELDKPKRDVATPFEFSNQFYNEDNQLEDDQERTMDNSTPISTSQPAKTMAVPKQVPESRNERLRKYLNKGGSEDVLREFMNDNDHGN